VNHVAYKIQACLRMLMVISLLAPPAFIGAAHGNTRTPHPEGLPSIWLNHMASELVEAYGPPDQILETAVRGIVIYGDTPTVMYVYASDPERGGGCIAAYVVELDTDLVLRYQCR
jgi:hypothetical protein